jgi:biopolymer transport protein ExbB/biopolymer transport protein TolQ
MGLASIFVAIERAIALVRARSASRALVGAIGPHFADNNPEAALTVAEDEQYKSAYLAHTLQAGLKEFIARPDRHGIEAAERAIQRAHIDEDAALRRGFGILATTGATCPFVGLVGTILGIIGAFQTMSEGGGDLDKLLLPIGEALIATAIGITVAIIGVWLFNFFNGMVASIVKDITTSELELMDWFEKQLLKSADSAAK